MTFLQNSTPTWPLLSWYFSFVVFLIINQFQISIRIKLSTENRGFSKSCCESMINKTYIDILLIHLFQAKQIYQFYKFKMIFKYSHIFSYYFTDWPFTNLSPYFEVFNWGQRPLKDKKKFGKETNYISPVRLPFFVFLKVSFS